MGLTVNSTGTALLKEDLSLTYLEEDSSKTAVVALAGNPNTGKSTVFNNLTGLKQHTGNWPGKTVAISKGQYTFNDENYVIVDVETTGLNSDKDRIIEIAAIKMLDNELIIFQNLIKIEDKLKNEIIELTGIKDETLASEGKSISIVLDDFLDFVGDSIIVGFINAELKKSGHKILKNKAICLLQETKRQQKLLRDYKLSTVLKKYNIPTEGLHRAYVDAKAEFELATKLNIF